MNVFQKIIILLFVNGVTALISQVVLGREFDNQIVYNFNLILFTFLSWLSGCVAAFYFVKERSKGKNSAKELNLLTAIMPIVGGFFITAAVIMIRYFKASMKIGPDAIIPDWAGMMFSAGIFVPISFIIFISFFCSLEAMKRSKMPKFIFPSVGAAAAGLVLGYAFYMFWAVKHYQNLDVLYTMGMINIVISYLFFRDKTIEGRYLMLGIIAALIIYLGFNMAGTKQKVDEISAKAMYKGYSIISQKEFPSSNFVMAKKEDVYYIYESGSLAYKIPNPRYPIIAKMATGARVLVINGGLVGMADALAKDAGIKEIVCVEADPYIAVVLEKVYKEYIQKKVEVKYISAASSSTIGTAIKDTGIFNTIIINPRFEGRYDGAIYYSKSFRLMLTNMLAEKGQIIIGGNN